MITCQELSEFLLDFLEGNLPEEERAVFEAHLEVCPPCVTYIDSYRKTIALGRNACREEERESPPEVPEPLIQAILATRRGIPPRDSEPPRA